MRLFVIVVIVCPVSFCAVVAVADLADTTASTVAKAGVRPVSAAVDLVLPDKKVEDRAKGK